MNTLFNRGTKLTSVQIESLKTSGNLIDIYSQEWMASKNNDLYCVEEFDFLIKQHGDEFTHHFIWRCRV